MNGPREERIRAFIAVSPSPEIHARLVRLKADLAGAGVAVRWVRDDGLHATLKFLGSVEQGLLEAIRRALGAVAERFAPFELAVAGLGVFPSLRRPRVVWVGLGGRRLAELAAAVERALEPLGWAPEGRPFRAHITLGRAVGTRGWNRLGEILEARRGEDLGRCTIDRVTAFRSHLQRGGSVYTSIWDVPLIVGSKGGEAHGT